MPERRRVIPTVFRMGILPSVLKLLGTLVLTALLQAAEAGGLYMNRPSSFGVERLCFSTSMPGYATRGSVSLCNNVHSWSRTEFLAGRRAGRGGLSLRMSGMPQQGNSQRGSTPVEDWNFDNLEYQTPLWMITQVYTAARPPVSSVRLHHRENT